jgi:nucleotide-binding universal stress UspA family protein
MAYRTILVHLDDHPRSVARLDVAIRLAQRFRAQLVGMYLQPSYEIYPFAAEMLPADFVQQSIEQRLDAQKASEAMFRETAAPASLAGFEFRAPAGDAYSVGTIHARYADLVIVGQPERGSNDYPFTNDLAHTLVMASGRPVLLVPYAGEVVTLGERVLVAWKDTREAARAVGDAMPLLREAKLLQAVTVAPKEDEGVEAFVAEQQLKRYFELHELPGKVKRIVAPDANAGEFLLSQAADTSADLIVMGGYSRRRIRELIWGGVTRTMLRSMTVPVLMAH